MSRMRRVAQKKTQALTRQSRVNIALLGELRAMIVQAREGRRFGADDLVLAHRAASPRRYSEA